jgi:hypothetical protein
MAYTERNFRRQVVGTVISLASQSSGNWELVNVLESNDRTDLEFKLTQPLHLIARDSRTAQIGTVRIAVACPVVDDE